RDRRHLCNTRILSRQGISHPGLSWHYDEQLNAMTCLGHSCVIYREFLPDEADSCVSVHRSCYTLLLGHMERSEGTGRVCGLMQRILPYINSQGVLALDPAAMQQRKRRFGHSQDKGREAWLMCDPTDLPPVAALDNRWAAGGCTPPALTLRVAARDESLDGHAGHGCADDMYIPRQLLTPPMSPAESSDGAFAPAASTPSPKLAPAHSLLMLPPHVLLSIVSHLQAADISALARTSSIFRMYLAPASPVWAQVCRMALSYTPRFLGNQQAADYYMRVRGNRRLEDRVLVQRERVEQTIRTICGIHQI
ncbi:hypothetical protein IWW55_004434, partial [Coemansia sp. RSA 2706]